MPTPPADRLARLRELATAESIALDALRDIRDERDEVVRLVGSERRSTDNTRVTALLANTRVTTVTAIAQAAGLSRETVHLILRGT